MLKFLDLVPSWVWAALVALFALVAGTCYVRMHSAKAELSDYRAQVAENTRIAESEARAKEQAMQKEAERVANEQAQKQEVLNRRIAATESVAGSLRDQILRLNSGTAPADPESAALFEQARTARELLGSCADRYKNVARAADELRDQVTGLQDFVGSVCTQQGK